MPRLSKIGAAALAAFGWTSGTSAVTASYLVVAGGGGGGDVGGGGGAGGYQSGTVSLSLTQSYTVVVGAGGAASSSFTSPGGNGSNSQFGSLTASVGGGGGGSASTGAGVAGGSGGGGAPGNAGGAATSGQGNAGGAGLGAAPGYPGGGGGGAGAVGQTAPNGSTGGAGGVGVSSSISGTATYYAGGGGGSEESGGTPGAGGNGGGGAGSASPTTTATSGTANTGGGGGSNGAAGTSGKGGSGIVVIAYTLPQKFGGGVVTSDGTNCIHTFTTSGTLTPLSQLSADYLIVAGGGGGGTSAGAGGGGGAGGLISGSALTIDTNSTYVVTVGSGGAASTNGANSSFSLVSTAAVGGGAGGGSDTNGSSGGSGGGASGQTGNSRTGGSATSGQGNAGGNNTNSANYGAGGGGGAGAVGGAGSTSASGAGGAGSSSSITGTATYYAGGGGGAQTPSGASAGAGGTGGGGAGGTGVGNAGTANTGGGGGGGNATTGGAGGSGVFILRYAGSTQQMAGGAVTITGGYVIHTFTSSGYLTPLTYFNNSLRFRKSASAYLSRTPSAAGNRKTWTFSAWVKRGELVNYYSLFTAYTDTNNTGGIFMPDILELSLYSAGTRVAWLQTSAVYRDPAAWYHIVVAIDTTQATSTERLKIYVNGTQVTSFANSIYPSQNTDLLINSTTAHYLGQQNYPSYPHYFDGYMTNINFIDGQALGPNSFGAFNSYGTWSPVTYGGSYGTNGFYLPFSGSTSYSGSFNGTSQYLNVNYSPNWSTLGDFTMECWLYPTSYSSSINCIGGTSHAQNDGYSMLYYYNTGKLAWGINGTNEFTSTTGIINTNVWQHVAVVRSGSNMVMYVNGQNVASTSSASTYLSNNTATMYIGSTSTANQYVVGNMSNFRFVTSAVYTSNFTPATAPLTAISNTQVLTLQSSTIVDNSGNSRTITNNGTVTTTPAFPFINQVALDYSPQGNNWTTNSFGSQITSGIDSMVDVPTLTSANVANYCVMNPLQQLNVTLSNGNLTYLAGSTGTYNYPCAGTTGISSGKFYWEVTVTSLTLYLGIGIFSLTDVISSVNNNKPVGFGSTSYCVYESGDKGNNATTSAYQSGGYATGNIVGVAFDATNGKIWFSKNGTFPNSGDPAAGTNAAFSSIPANTYLPALSGNSCTLDTNFGQRPFTYTPPSGYTPLNTYNM